MTKLFAILISTTLLVALAACSVHKSDVQQGNVITQEMMEKLTVGMDKRQVKLLLGSPLIDDPFHSGRWDYVYSYKMGNSPGRQYAYVTLDFDGERLTKIDVHAAPPKESEIKKPTLGAPQ
jgi:outer membrane protein assembly factor BamE